MFGAHLGQSSCVGGRGRTNLRPPCVGQDGLQQDAEVRADPDWQRTYELETPLWLPAGTELLATGVFDNSYLNPNNPDPSATVQYGQQSSDEMFSVRYKFRHAQPAIKNTKGGSTQ